MKKRIWFCLLFFALLIPMTLFASDAAAEVPVPFDWKVFIQQIMTNGGLTLVGFLAAKIPGGFGKLVKKFIDFLSANPEHK